MNYTRFTNLDVDGKLNVDGEVVLPAGVTVGGAQVVKCVKLSSVKYNTTAGATIGKLPKGCLAVGGIVEITTAFNGTTPTLNIGLASDADGLVANSSITVGTKGVYVKLPAATNVVGASGGTNVTATVGGTSVTAGAADVWLLYVEL